MYYSVDEIEAESYRVPATFTTSLPGLENFCTENEVEKGKTVSLPLWLAIELAVASGPETESGFVELQVPRPFQLDVLNALKTDPSSVNLYTLCPVFTHLALRWIQEFDASAELTDILYNAMQARIVAIYDSAVSRRALSLHLDENERLIYQTAFASTNDFKQWMKYS